MVDEEINVDRKDIVQDKQKSTEIRTSDGVLVATPNQASSGLIRRCSTATIEDDIMALMLCPSALSAPTLMGHFYA